MPGLVRRWTVRGCVEAGCVRKVQQVDPFGVLLDSAMLRKMRVHHPTLLRRTPTVDKP